MRTKTLLCLALITMFITGLYVTLQKYDPGNNETQLITGRGNPKTLKLTFERWKQRYTRNQGGEILSLPLAYSRAFSKETLSATGSIQINLLDGKTEVTVMGLDNRNEYDLWFIDNQKEPDLSDSANRKVKIGSLQYKDETHQILTWLNRSKLEGFKLDQVVVAKVNQTPNNGGLLYGSPSFFQRLFYADQLWTITDIGNVSHPENQGRVATPFQFLLPKPVLADGLHRNLEVILGEQIAKGRDLFINETFDGNGRTCETCHRLDNNHTIDPNYIATLRDDDPLFVHENNPDLANLENAQLIRQLALFKANIDGFDKPATLRAAPHTLSLGLSMGKEPAAKDPEIQHCEDMLGWSGDGSPNCGSLRMFAIGAIIQHLPRTLGRTEGEDFRLPTEDELDAIEAYLLSLGRQDPWNLDSMAFSSPIVEKGKELFHSKDPSSGPFTTGTGECKGCHFHAGAISSSTLANGNRNTGIEDLPHPMHRLIDATIPIDGGFGDTVNSDCGINNDQPCYGNKKFSMVDAFRADTAPFFHNHSVNTIEEAVAFYNSDAFNNADDRGIKMESSTVVAIALFLRTLSAVDNVDSAYQQLEHSKGLRRIRHSRKIIHQALADSTDATEVLMGGQVNVNPEALILVNKAIKKQKKARKTWSWNRRKQVLTQAQTLLMAARDAMVTE